MADKIQKSYSASRNFYDDVITHRKWWSKIYSKLIWNGVNDPEIAEKLLSFIADDFSGAILDVPVGTAIFTHEKYSGIKNASITCVDYSEDMLSIAKERLLAEHITTVQGDVGKLAFANEQFDIVFSMNGFHAFPDKEAAFFEVDRVLKPGGLFICCMYVKEKLRAADFVVKNILAKKGWFTPPFETEASLKQRLQTGYSIEFFSSDGAIAYFVAKKK